MGQWDRTRDAYGRFVGLPDDFVPKPVEERRHGCISTYHAGCRCTPCRGAAARARRRAPSRAQKGGGR